MTTSGQRRAAELYGQIRAHLAADAGHEVFLAYGTLLGAVREGRFLGDDTGFDAAYVSGHGDPGDAARHHYERGSTFQAEIAARPDTPAHVIDVGCGDGRDSLAFAAGGRTGLGLDRSEFGVAHAAEQAERAGLRARARFAVCDVGDASAVRGLVGGALGEEPVLFYLRFFLHSIPEHVQETLLATLAGSARPGDCLAAEFRTDKDEHTTKVHGGHYRRFQNGPALGLALDTRFGFAVLSEQEGTGLSPYGEEDPELYRVVARREPCS